MTQPYSIPTRISPDLARVHSYWKSLLRGAANMPFWDDVNLSDLPNLVDQLLLIDAFERPERFRFNHLGQALRAEALTGKFIDEIEPTWPFQFLRSQCSATIEAAAPSYYRQEAGARTYERLLLPLWGEGRIGMLMGAVDLTG